MANVFISYASQDFDDNLKKLFRDLRASIAGQAGIAPEDVFFRDYDSLKLGEDFQPGLAHGLGQCRLFLAIWSPTYFNRPYCGKEWTAFLERVAGGHDPARARRAILPLWWIPLDASLTSLPASLASTQSAVSDLPDDYMSVGVRALLMTRDEKDYNKLVLQFSKLVAKALKAQIDIEAAGQLALGSLPATKTLEEYENAFVITPRRTPAPSDAATPAGGPRKRVWFAIAAGTRAELNGIHTQLDSYDADDPAGWCPFTPACAIDEDLNEAARAEGMWADFSEIVGDLPTAARAQRRRPVIVIADPWSLALARLQNALGTIDENFLPNLGAIVPYLPNGDEVPESLRRTFRNRLGGVDKDAFFYPISRREELVPAVRKLIALLRKRILDTLPPPTGGTFPSAPKLNGPGT